MSEERAQNWETIDNREYGYLEETKSDIKGYESDPTEKASQVPPRTPLSNPFTRGGDWYRKTVIRRKGQPYFKIPGGEPFQTPNIL